MQVAHSIFEQYVDNTMLKYTRILHWGQDISGNWHFPTRKADSLILVKRGKGVSLVEKHTHAGARRPILNKFTKFESLSTLFRSDAW